MEKQILEELKEPNVAIVQLAGTSNLPKAEPLSATALDKAAKELQKQQKQVTSGYLNINFTSTLRMPIMALANLYEKILSPFQIFSRSCFGLAKRN